MQPLIAVLGPSGSGKSQLAARLCRQFGGEIVSCDSMQVYRGMDIGTNKEQFADVPTHLLDWKQPGERVTVAEYQARAYEVIDSFHTRGVLPILTGVAMQYAEAITHGYVFGGPGGQEAQPRYRVLELGIAVSKEALAQKLSHRTERWLKEGLVEEVQSLRGSGVSDAWLMSCGQEYRYVTQYLRGELSLEEAVEKTNASLRQYAKRWRTWYRRPAHQDMVWVEGYEEAKSAVQTFLG